MSSWVNVSGFMVIGDGLPCNFGEHLNDEEWVGNIVGTSVAEMLGNLLIGARQNMLGYRDEDYSPMLNPLRIEWRKLYNYGDDDEPREYEDVEYEWYELTEEDKKALLFPCGSECPLDITVTPYMDKWGSYWHIVIDGGLRDRTSAYFEDLQKWWKTLQKFFNVSSGYIFARSGDKEWEDKIINW